MAKGCKSWKEEGHAIEAGRGQKLKVKDFEWALVGL